MWSGFLCSQDQDEIDFFSDPVNVLSIASIMLLMLLNTHRALTLCATVVDDKEESPNESLAFLN